MSTQTETLEQSIEAIKFTKFMLMSGVLFGPIFYLLVIINILIRHEFDITRHPISLLALGDLGWIQTTNFILTGLLAIFGSFGMYLSLNNHTSSNWATTLTFSFGIGVIIAAIFPADPSLGFPEGTPDETSSTLSTTAQLHGFGFMVAFGSLIIACFTLRQLWMEQGKTNEARIALTIGILTPLLIILGFVIPKATSILFAITGIPVFGLINFTNFRLLQNLDQQGLDKWNDQRSIDNLSLGDMLF